MNKKQLEIITEQGWDVDTLQELEDMFESENILYGDTCNLIIEITDGVITEIILEPIAEQETLFGMEDLDE